MSPRRGDRVTVPPRPEHWDVRFGTSDAVTGWEELCRHALSNTTRCLEMLRLDPRSGAGHDRQHRLRGTWRRTATMGVISSSGNSRSRAAAAFAMWWMTFPAPSG
jgi:hypothetical protein